MVKDKKDDNLKPLDWVGSAKRELMTFPKDVRSEIGFALHLAQTGFKGINVKPLKGFSGSGVLEVVEDYDGDTYRAVYTVKLVEVVYVLHCFQKKSKKGIETPKQTLDLIKRRLKAALEMHENYRSRVDD